MSNAIAIFTGELQRAENKFTGISEEQKTGLVYQSESQYAMQAIKNNGKLLQCAPDSFYDAIINVASVGLSLNPATKLAYLVPRDGRVCLDISYRGLVNIATSGDSIKWAKAELVYENDRYEDRGFNNLPVHECDPFSKNRGEIIGGYCAAQLSDGTYLVDRMSIAEINKVRACSKAQNGPWKTWPEEMMKKTLIKRASKSWPLVMRLAVANSILDQHEGLRDEYIEGEYTNEEAEVETITEEQGDVLMKMIAASKIRPERVLNAFSIDNIYKLPLNRLEECRAKLSRAVDAHLSKQEAMQ